MPLPDAGFDLAVSEYGASLWCDPARWIPEAARLLRPDGRLVFLTNSMLATLCFPSGPGHATESLQRPQRGMYAVTWEVEDGVEFHLGHGDVDRPPPRSGIRGRAPGRAVRARRCRDARVLRHGDGRLGAQVAERRPVGGAQDRLILASTSPQRRAILEQLRIPFEVVPPDVRRGGSARRRPGRARAQARRGQGALGRTRTAVTLGVDTTVVLDGRVYGKAADARDARRILSELSGRTHTVVSGVCLLGGAEDVVEHVETDVTFRPLGHRAVDAYLESGEWEGRAGAYAIQGLGGRLVERIEGDYLNVVGLPGALLVSLLERHAPELLTF